MFTTGHVYGCIGAALAFIMASLGSSIAVGRAGKMAGALLTKDPSKFSQFLILQILPATQSIYSFIVAFMALINMGLLGGGVSGEFTTSQGLAMLLVCLPIGIVGFGSALLQGAVAMSGMELCMKQNKQMGRAMTMAALVELFAILAFVISLMGVLGI